MQGRPFVVASALRRGVRGAVWRWEKALVAYTSFITPAGFRDQRTTVERHITRVATWRQGALMFVQHVVRQFEGLN